MNRGASLPLPPETGYKLTNIFRKWYKENGSSYPQSDTRYEELKPFAFPLAAALSHGQRMIVKLINVTDMQMYNLLLSGDPNLVPTIAFMRSFASHQVTASNNELFENKVVAGVDAAIRGNHRGVNVPLGGVGNKNELGYFIGAEGQSYANEHEHHESISHLPYQLGHVYIRRDNFASAFRSSDITLSSLLMGVESNSPLTTSPFLTGSSSHTPLSALKSSSGERSVTGGQKWAKILPGIGPATYGGSVVVVSPAQFAQLKALYDIVLSLSDNQQSKLFKDLLMGNAAEALAALKAHSAMGDFIFLDPIASSLQAANNTIF